MVTGSRRRPDWLDRAREALQVLAGLVGEVARLIAAIRGLR
jgi:hypothetical protein